MCFLQPAHQLVIWLLNKVIRKASPGFETENTSHLVELKKIFAV